jgi:hypothetical protein
LRCSRRRVRRLFHARITSTTFANNSVKVALAFQSTKFVGQPIALDYKDYAEQ